MRLWHYKLIPYLPKSQLLAQWRELNSIFVKQNKHILINYIYEYDKEYLYCYTQKVLGEFIMRDIKVSTKSLDNMQNYFADTKQKLNEQFLSNGFENTLDKYIFVEHDTDYLTMCYYNLKEKYIRRQKDFDKDTWRKLQNFYYYKGVIG